MQYHSNIIFLREYLPYAVPNHDDEVATLVLELKMASKVSITMVNTGHCMDSWALIILIEYGLLAIATRNLFTAFLSLTSLLPFRINILVLVRWLSINFLAKLLQSGQKCQFFVKCP